MRKKYLIIFILVCACFFSPLRAQQGSSCDNPIEIGRNYSETVSGPGIQWYKANTFDLPLTVKFYPASNTDTSPQIKLDFSCTPGDYEDPILCSLFCEGQSTQITMPYTIPSLDRKTDSDGHVYYLAELGAQYRDLLLRAGISYNVNVYIQVTFFGGGGVDVTPDNMSTCLDTDKWLLLGVTRSVEAEDKATYFVAPYANWTEDSVRYVWSGTKPAIIAIGTTCDFDPMDASDPHRVEVMEMSAQDTVNHSNAKILSLANNTSVPGGIYYVKALSDEPGTLKVEHIPEYQPADEMEELEYDKPSTVRANNTDALYVIPNTWTSATRFDTPTDRIFKMYIGITPDFDTQDAIATYQFNKSEDGNWFGLEAADLAALWEQTTDKYLYVRFACSANTTVTPSLWTVSDCVGKSTLLEKNSTRTVRARADEIYRIYYNDWKDGSIIFSWDKTTVCNVLVSGKCTIGTSATASGVIASCKPKKNQPYEFSAEVVNSWESSVDADGFIYMRFYPSDRGNLTITSKAPVYGDTTATACSSFTWYGTEYTQSTTTTHKLENVAGCDSIVTLYLTINQPSTGDTTATACSSFTWYGTKYTQSTTATHKLENAVGCDSIVTLHLTINQPSTGDTTATACSSFTWYGTEYTQSGTATHKLENAAGCDSIVTLHLTINQPSTGDTTATACSSFTWYGTEYTQSGTATHKLENAAGCDSIVTLHLTINQPSTGDTTATACSSFTWYGTEYTQSGTATHKLENVAGCDSIVTLHLTINQPSTGDTTATACSSFTWYGTQYTQSTTATHKLENAAGCDSIVTLHLTINQPSTGDTTATACGSFTWYGTEYTQSGTTTHKLENTAGCDSIVTLHLTINQPTTGDTTATACSSFTWYGTEYTQSGTATHKLENAVGCDSIVTLHLTINQPSTGDTTATACSSFTWYGTEYTQSGTATHKLENAVGCDSIVTLHLTINQPSTGDTTATACSSFTWYGTEYTQSGTATHKLENVAGCDSIVTLHLTINQPSPTPEVNQTDTTVCDTIAQIQWRGKTFAVVSPLRDTVMSVCGFDSVYYIKNVLIDHCVKPDPDPEPEPGPEPDPDPQPAQDTLYTLIVNKYNWRLLLDNVTLRRLFPNRTARSYQWYKNDQLIPGATDDDYSEQQELNGRYQLRIGLDNDQTIWSNILKIGETQAALPVKVWIFNYYGMPVREDQVTHGIYLYRYEQGDNVWTEKKLIP